MTVRAKEVVKKTLPEYLLYFPLWSKRMMCRRTIATQGDTIQFFSRKASWLSFDSNHRKNFNFIRAQSS